MCPRTGHTGIRRSGVSANSRPVGENRKRATGESTALTPLIVVPALIALPFVLVALACLVAAIRAKQDDLPEVIKYLAESLRSRNAPSRQPSLPRRLGNPDL